jgi:hypothetical protein
MTKEKSKRLENMDSLLHTEVEHKEHGTGWIIQEFSYLLETK